MGDISTTWIDIQVFDMTREAIRIYDGAKYLWLPKSQIIDMEDDLDIGVETKIEIPEWLAIDKGLV